MDGPSGDSQSPGKLCCFYSWLPLPTIVMFLAKHIRSFIWPHMWECGCSFFPPIWAYFTIYLIIKKSPINPEPEEITVYVLFHFFPPHMAYIHFIKLGHTACKVLNSVSHYTVDISPIIDNTPNCHLIYNNIIYSLQLGILSFLLCLIILCWPF